MNKTLVFPTAEPNKPLTLAEWARRASVLRGIHQNTARRQIAHAIKTGDELYNTTWKRITPPRKPTRGCTPIVIRTSPKHRDYLAKTRKPHVTPRTHAALAYASALDYVIANNIDLDL